MKNRLLLALLALLALFVPAPLLAQAPAPSAFPYAKPVLNDTGTGTQPFTLTKINANGNAVVMATSDVNGFSGVCVSNCGTSFQAWLAWSGFVPVKVDGSTTVDDYLTISTITAGFAHDTGASTYPTSGLVIGRVVQSSSGSGSVSVVDLAPEFQAATSTSPVNVQTGSYTMAASDLRKLILMNCTAACTLTFNGTPSAGFYGAIESIGSTVATINLNGKNYNSATAVPALNSFKTLSFWSDGTNYFGDVPSVAGTGITLTPASNGLTVGLTSSTATVNGAACALGGSCTANPVIVVANAGTTGTTASTLTKLTGAPSTAVIAATTDTGGVVGVTVSGAGTAGSATVQLAGTVNCVFDGATTAGDYVQISSTTGGDCHDAGATYPLSGQVIGRVLSTNAAGGTFAIDLYDEIQGIGNSHRTSLPLQCSDTSGSATAQSCSTGGPAAVKGDWIIYYTTTANTGGLTVAVNGGSAASVLKWDATALVANDVLANKPVLMLFDGTNWLVSTIGNAPSGSGSSSISSLTAATVANSTNNGNFTQTLNFSITSANGLGLALGENVASTGSGATLFPISTLAGSTATLATLTQGAGASGASPPNILSYTSGAGGAASTATSAGNNGGAYSYTTGAGSAGGATSGTGGNGGGFNFTTGLGGNAAGGSTNGNGGNYTVNLGNPGTGGTGGLSGQLNVLSSSTTPTNPGLSVQQSVAATGSANFSSPAIELSGNYFNVSSLRDVWDIQNQIGPGTGTPTSNLNISHTGSGTGSTTVTFMNFVQIRTASIGTNGQGTLTYQGGTDANNPAGAVGSVILRGADIAGGSSALNVSGAVTIRGGNDAGTSTSSTAGSVTIQPGAATGVTSASSSWGKLIFDSFAAFNTGTTNVGDLACLTATQTVASCATAAANTRFIGVIQATATNSVYVQTQGLASVNSSAAASFTAGDYVCVDGTNAGKVVDGGTTACAAGSGVGIVYATDASVTSHSVALRIF